MISNLTRTPFSFKLLNKHWSYEGNRGCIQNDSPEKKNQARIVTFQLLVIEADLMALLLEHCTGNWRVMGTLFSVKGRGGQFLSSFSLFSCLSCFHKCDVVPRIQSFIHTSYV